MAELDGTVNFSDGELVGELGAAAIGGGIKSHVGMIIHSTTLDTEEKVIELYGGKKWERIIGRFLLGADSNHNVNATGGYFDSVVPRHSHDVENNEVTTDYHSETEFATEPVFGEISYTSGSEKMTVATGITGQMVENGHYHTVPKIAERPGGGTSVVQRINVTGEALQSVTEPFLFYKSGSFAAINNTAGKVTVKTKTAEDSATPVDTLEVNAGRTEVFKVSDAASYVEVTFDKAGTVTVTNEAIIPKFVDVLETGENRSEGNMPPYKVVYIWERTA